VILFFYNLALLLALVVGTPWWLWRVATTRKYREGLAERLGRVRQLAGRGGRPLIWVHAVSVGEVLAVTRLVKELDEALPGIFVAISTTTRTGQALARERFGEGRVFYCPLDLPWAVRAHLNARQPRLLVLAETEFWPNLLSGCFRRGIPVAVVNARVSDRSWPRYRRLRGLWRPFLQRLSSVLAQSETDAERLVAIGCAAERVSVAGNLKFDVRATGEAEAVRLLKALRGGLRLVVAGSTLEGEEAALLEAWPRLLQADPRLALVLAPRHPERFAAVADLVEASGYPWNRRTHWQHQPAGAVKLLKPGQIVLLDSIGELASVYSAAAVAFVGGSLVPAGGHNPLEPAQFGVPTVMGPHYANFRAIAEDLRAHEGLRIAESGRLAEVLTSLLLDGTAAAVLGQRGRQAFERQAGATARCVTAILELVGNAGPKDEASSSSAPKSLATGQDTNSVGVGLEVSHVSDAIHGAPRVEAGLDQAKSVDQLPGTGFSARRLLTPLIPAYRLGLWMSERRLGSRAEPVRRLRYPVVSIGNLSTGGAGKTPLAIALARALTERGFRVDVLSRGYGRKSEFALRVDAEGTAEEFGDEPLLIAREAGVPVYVAAQRFDAGRLAEADVAAALADEEVKPVVHLLDDGFQHRQLARDVDILLLDRRDWEDALLPAGNRREPLNAIHRASVVAIPAYDTALENELRAWGWTGPVWRVRRSVETPAVAGPVLAFCGIARPEQFFAGLEAGGLQIAGRKAFPDHAAYKASDLERLIAEARSVGAVALVTTEKDRVRMGAMASCFPEDLPLKTARLQSRIENQQEAIDWLVGRVQAGAADPPL